MVNPQYEWYRHCEVLAERLEQVARGNLNRLMVFMPPRHGKSELTSRLFPAYFLASRPSEWIGVSSYGAQLAYGFSRAARDHYQRAGGPLKDDSAKMSEWETGIGGGLWAAGVGGPITGRGFHVGIIDDPIKNATEAQSNTIREKHKNWWRSTFTTRQEPGSRIVIIQTRWHKDDLSGWLLRREQQGRSEGWHIVNFEAVREGRAQFPESCTVENDWREEGDPLCPERYDEEDLEDTKDEVGSYYWSALYQQQPQSVEGALWDREQLDELRVSDKPALKRIVVAIDPAVSKSSDSDDTGMVAAGLGVDGHCYVLRSRGEKMSPNTWARQAVRWYEELDADRIVGEVNQGGDLVESNIRTVDERVSFKQVRATRGAQVRAEPISALYEQGKVHHLNMHDELEDHMTSWDASSGAHCPDDVAALVWAITELMLERRSEAFVAFGQAEDDWWDDVE